MDLHASDGTSFSDSNGQSSKEVVPSFTMDEYHKLLSLVRTPSASINFANPEGKYEALDKYGKDLTAMAREGKLDPVIGRDDEIRRCIQILSRRTKNNPVLIGATNGAMIAANLLKPMLGRGELRCIGATTLDEYRKYIDKDPALERRFQQVYVDQPTVEDAISILRGLRERYELHHGVRISDSPLVEAALLSDPIDLVDEAAAKLKMEITSKPTALDEINRAVLKLEMERLSLTNDTDKASKG
ncbi:Chaperone protein [Nymphaea thermarum]|nr:Chaperone protein [Nymphaea thermarum]